MTEEVAVALYQTALDEAAEIAGESVSKGFKASRQRTADEFEEFLEALGWGIGFETATDVDVIAFIQGWWLPGHLKNCRTVNGRGEKVVSASSVKSAIQHLSKTYSMRGRESGRRQSGEARECEKFLRGIPEPVARRRRAGKESESFWRWESGGSDRPSGEASRGK